MNKGYEALEVYNYFEAKKQFEKGLERNTSPSAHGLSQIYFRNDNPFHQVDSAYHYGLLAVESYNEADEKKQLKWLEKADYNLEKALALRSEISNFFFKAAIDSNTVMAMKHFIAKHPWSSLRDSAIYVRDELAFENTQNEGKSISFQTYLKRYPESHRYEEAKEAMYEAQYLETITAGSIESFNEFVLKYPNNPYVAQANKKLYELSTVKNTIAEYESFIREFPESPYINEAWKNLYRLSIADYSKGVLLEFEEEHPSFPFPEMIESDLELVGKELFLIKKNTNFGFMNREGQLMIDADYSYASNFSNGLAVVVCNDKFGYIDKSGQIVIDCVFDEAQDFNQGIAIVEKDGYFGLIGTTGDYILKPEFLDVGALSEGLFYAENEKGFKYYAPDGSVAISTRYDQAFTFENGLAKVKIKGVVGFIKNDGSFFVQTKQGDLRRFKDTLFVLKLRDSSTFMGPSGMVGDQYYDRIGVLKENRAIVSKNGKYGYVNGNSKIVIGLKRNEYSNYFQFAQFENGHAKVFRQERYALMDSLGDNILPAIFTGIGAYGELIPVTKGDGWGYADAKVRLKIKYNYDYAYPFVNGLAIVERDGFSGLIGLNGEEITPINFTELTRITFDHFIFRSENRNGLLNSKGEKAIDQTFLRISEVRNGLIRCENEQEIMYYDITKNELITLKE